LVLGAGASIPYGFPSGSDLYERVLKSLEKPTFLDVLAELGHDRNAAREFREGLVMSGVRSVDAFLEHREEFVDLGKLCIARGVMMHEEPGRITDSDARSDGWYHYVWNILRCARNRWTDNQLRFVDDIYQSDAYHSLSIEGYRVTPELIERVRSGDWNPSSDDADHATVKLWPRAAIGRPFKP
jgi:hypothetical protein